MDQGSNEWLQWRNQGIGSSDAPSIMGVGYKTPRQLYLEKTGQVKVAIDQGKQWLFEKGHKVERQARALLEIEHGGVEFKAGLIQMIDYPFIRASMDGANFELSEGKEFKLVSKAEFDAGVCPERYYPQIMHQYLVSGLKKIDIVLCCEVGKLKLLKIKEVEVPLDLEYIHKKLVPALFDFWWRVQNKVPPDLMPGDAIRIKDKKVIEKIKRYEATQKKLAKMRLEIAKLESGLPHILDDISTQMTEDFMLYNKKLYRKQVVKTVRIECL
jgi:putative phage-type endonuclease